MASSFLHCSPSPADCTAFPFFSTSKALLVFRHFFFCPFFLFPLYWNLKRKKRCRRQVVIYYIHNQEVQRTKMTIKSMLAITLAQYLKSVHSPSLCLIRDKLHKQQGQKYLILIWNQVFLLPQVFKLKKMGTVTGQLMKFLDNLTLNVRWYSCKGTEQGWQVLRCIVRKSHQHCADSMTARLSKKCKNQEVQDRLK